MTKPIFFLTTLLSAAVLSSVNEAFTNQDNAVVPGPNFRTLRNSVKPGYQGYLDVWTDGRVFTTDMKVTNGQAWPQIMEGVTSGIESQFTPGYPISVHTYIEELNGERYIQYYGSWRKRINGPDPKGEPTGNRYNGAYIWLNNPFNYDGRFPKWPFSVEVNIWNKHDLGIPSNTHYHGDYYDSNGKYTVHGRQICPDGNCFFAFYFLLDKAQETSSMLINVKALLRFLRDNGGLHTGLDIVGIYVAAEGHGAGSGRPAADGRFLTVINHMGRP